MSDDLEKQPRRIAKRLRELEWAWPLSIEREDIDEAASALEDQDAEITRLRQEGKMMDWQPIETAPRDGTKILIWDAGEDGFGQVVARYETRDGWAAIGSSTDMMNIGRVRWHVAARWHLYQLIKNPTHWMPLPAPPKDRPSEEIIREDRDAWSDSQQSSIP